MPNLSKLKTMGRKLWGFLLGEESWFGTVTLICVVLIVLIAWADVQLLLGTPLHGWLMHLLQFIAVAMYVYAAARVYRLARNLWRALPAYIQRIKDDINGKIRPKTLEMEAAEAANTVFLRSIYLVAGLVLLVAAIPDNPMLVSLSFAVGLLGAFLISQRDLRDNSHEKTRTIEIGRLVLSGIRSKVYPREIGMRVFVCAMTVYIFYFLDTDVTLMGWGAGFICGHATFNDNWQGLAAQWPNLKKEIRSIVSIKKSPSKKD